MNNKFRQRHQYGQLAGNKSNVVTDSIIAANLLNTKFKKNSIVYNF